MVTSRSPALLLAACLFVAPAAARAQTIDAELRAAEEQLAAALTKKGRDTFERLLAPGFVLRGAPDVDRDTWIRNALGMCWGSSYEISDFSVRGRTADMAIVSFLLTTGQDPVTCEPAIIRSLLTDVWMQTTEGWQLVLRHSGPAGSAVAQQFAKTEPPPPRWERAAELSLVATGGNTDTQTLGAGGSLVYRPGVWVTRARVTYVRSATDGVDTAESLVGDLRQSRQLSPRADVYGRTTYLKDRFAGIDYRVTFDAGLGWQIVEAAPHSLKLDAGAGLTHESRLTAPADTFAIATGTALYRFRFTRTGDFTEQLRLTMDLGEAGNWRLQNAAALTVTVTRLLSLRVAHELKRTNRPVPGFRATDTMLSAALVAKW